MPVPARYANKAIESGGGFEDADRRLGLLALKKRRAQPAQSAPQGTDLTALARKAGSKIPGEARRDPMDVIGDHFLAAEGVSNEPTNFDPKTGRLWMHYADIPPEIRAAHKDLLKVTGVAGLEVPNVQQMDPQARSLLIQLYKKHQADIEAKLTTDPEVQQKIAE